MRNSIATALALSVLLAFNLRADAACIPSVPMLHGLDSYFACDDGGPVSALAYQLTDPLGTNTGYEDIVLEGPPFDGHVTVQTDWSNYGITGCPVTTVGPQRVVLVVQDRLGKGLIVSFSGADPSLGYFVETSHPFDTSTSQIAPLRCGDRSGQPTIVSQTESVPGQVNLSLRFQPPLVYSDCDAGSVGISLGTTCTDSFQANATLAGLYTSVQACTGAADLRRSYYRRNCSIH